ncbi:MAG: class I SAM-dependent methyltransferase [Candidatus Omnitrophica bacterium]|nr:class I SAM-dependent methyltransferase [Candidatus Omnitrophota bacterium]
MPSAEAGSEAARACPLCRARRSRVISSGQEGILFLRCPGCDVGYWEDLWDEERVRGHYHAYYSPAGAWDDPITRSRYESILARMERFRPPGRILDVGCGAGQFLAVAESRGWRGTGLEVSRSALDLLKQRRGAQFQVMETTLQELDLPEGSFDAVTLFEVLEHLDQPVELLRRAAALLKEGGLLYLTTPNLNSLSRRLLGGRWRVIAPEHRCLFSPASIRQALEKARVRPIEMRTKNLDLPEIFSKLRGLRTALHPTHQDSNSQRFRRAVEHSPWLQTLKRTTNGLLSLWGGGDTIELLAVKRG